MANELYRTYEVLVEESIHPKHPKRAKGKDGNLLKTDKPERFNPEIDGALRDTHMIFQDAVCFNTLCFAGLAGVERHKSGERAGDLLNPLWEHLTTPAAKGGIKEETERVIRRLATHYAPLKEVKTAEEFLNCVYSVPLQIQVTMSEEQKTLVLEKRAACYEMMEDAARNKKTGELNCEGMAPFAKTWTGLMCVGKKASIPSELPYARIAVELGGKIKPGTSDEELDRIFSETIESFRAAAEAETNRELELRFEQEAEKLKQVVAKLEALPAESKGRSAKLDAARDRLEKFRQGKQQWIQSQSAEIRAKLTDDVKKAVAQRFMKQTTAGRLEMKDAEFAEARVQAASVDPAAKSFFRLQPAIGRRNNLEAGLFRYWLLRDHKHPMVLRAAVREFRWLIEKTAPAKAVPQGEERSKKMPFSPEAKHAFRFFGTHCLEIEGGTKGASSPFREMDVTAFQTAVEDVFKYKIRTAERVRKVARLRTIVGAFEGKGLNAVESPTGSRIPGMEGDPRWDNEGENRKGIVQLIAEMSGEKEIGRYGLREGTIGGWAEVRKAFLDLHPQGRGKQCKVLDIAKLEKDLEAAVDEEMNANRQGFGSADFFHALCATEYHHLWLDGSDCVRNGIKDFVPHYVEYCEKREEFIELLRSNDGPELDSLSFAELRERAEKPIRYTWPGLLNRHKKPSYRYYDFGGKLNTAFQFKTLFRRIPTRDGAGKEVVGGYKILTGDDAKVTLAARRLKRDKIMSKDKDGDGWNSVDALWCPPLVLEGEPNPTAATKPQVLGNNKKKGKGGIEISFSLIASPLPGDAWLKFAGNSIVAAPVAEPVHLTVSFKIEANALAHLQNEGVYFASGSARGVEEKDEKRRFLRWPVDIETDKQAAKDRAEKAKREPKNDGKAAPKKFDKKADVAPGKLWCAFDSGFLVKESRYIETTKTKRVPDFHVLSIDLGNRFAAAFTRLRVHAGVNAEGRVISADGFSPVIKAELTREGTLRLQGENAKVWDHVRNEDGTCKKDANGNYVYALEDETYGNGGRGRFPTAKEYEDFSTIAGRLVPVTSLSLAGTDKQTYPELGDHLGFRLKRRIGRLRTLFNLVWRLCGKNERDNRTGKHDKPRTEKDWSFHRRMAVETLARSAFPKRPRQPGEDEEPGDQNLRVSLAPLEQWQKLKASGLLDSLKGAADTKRREDLEAALKDAGIWKWDALADAVKKQIGESMEGPDALDKLLVAVIEFCMPLRGRHWRWNYVPNGERLSWEDRDSSPDWKPNIMGMRGLSMKRLEQILNLRQRCQSFAKLETRYHGPYKFGDFNPPDSTRDELADCCPLLLERSNRIREQRVDQTAHLILAEALGMELKNPAEVADKKRRKVELDLHGEYQRRKDKNGKPYPRCSVIVLENLERYKTSQERTKMENSRLMQWAHRAIIEKLEDMCRPFGITLMLVDPAFSSHFDSRTGLPGVRVNQVSAGFENEYPYNRWIEGKNKKGTKTRLAEDIESLAELFKKHDYKGELVLAVEGGKEFVPVAAPSGNDGPINADVCAAGNIGLRGIADPQRWDVFPRLRTKQVSETEVSVLSWRGWFGKFPQDTKEKKSEQRRMKASAGAGAPVEPASRQATSSDGADNTDSQSSQSSEYPWFFVEPPGFPRLHDGDRLMKEAYEFKQGDTKLRAFPQGAYLKRVEQLCAHRINDINRARIQKAERDGDDIPM